MQCFLALYLWLEVSGQVEATQVDSMTCGQHFVGQPKTQQCMIFLCPWRKQKACFQGSPCCF